MFKSAALASVNTRHVSLQWAFDTYTANGRLCHSPAPQQNGPTEMWREETRDSGWGGEGVSESGEGKGREGDRGRCWIVMHVKVGGVVSPGSGERGRRMSLRSVESVMTGERSRDLWWRRGRDKTEEEWETQGKVQHKQKRQWQQKLREEKTTKKKMKKMRKKWEWGSKVCSGANA